MYFQKNSLLDTSYYTSVWKSKEKRLGKDSIFWFFTVSSLSAIFHMQMLMVCQAQKKPA